MQRAVLESEGHTPRLAMEGKLGFVLMKVGGQCECGLRKISLM